MDFIQVFKNVLKINLLYDKLYIVKTEEYPSPAEGIGLENRQGC